MRVIDMKKGSVTVEAAIALPVFLCVIISIIFLIKVVYTHELIQHALTETADEIASTGYIYYISGLRDLNDSVRNDLQDRADVFKDHIGTVMDTFSSFNNLTESRNETTGSMDELKNIACLIASGAFNDVKTELFTPVVKLYIKKYFKTENVNDADTRLKELNVKDGLEGLDFSESGFFVTNDDIDIVVRYSMDFPVPIKFFPELIFVQRASAKAWMGGDESKGVIEGEDGSGDIWSLNNFQRGSKLRTIFGANLPSSFPVIARFDAGNAVMIKSMDLTAESYKNGATVIETLDGYMKKLVRYKGQEKPWGNKGIVIKESEIKQKELLLVIPQNALSPQTEGILSDFMNKALHEGVKLRIERYGIKKID